MEILKGLNLLDQENNKRWEREKENVGKDKTSTLTEGGGILLGRDLESVDNIVVRETELGRKEERNRNVRNEREKEKKDKPGRKRHSWKLRAREKGTESGEGRDKSRKEEGDRNI